ncbi:flavoprotein [Rhodococcus sp. ACS1]|uniref:globin domain-containing protein n=1 Tax=Rhodococcus sp. ACS1 TaxID=2028570 RepID=UPI000BB0EEA6|nr:globin domain-containing protein [Rhodococcus sp. ACS1]PBC35072.1 flavoprotein [Rhodococcus sp. ACS1]
MDPLTISLVRSSFKSIGAIPEGEDTFARSFYAILFATHPETRQHFPAAMDIQRDRLMRAIGYVIDQLETPESVLPLLAQLGRDHRKYGVTEDHYTAVGEALLAALANLAGPELWTDETDHAWRLTIALIASIMTEAANSDEGPPTRVGTVIEHRRVLDDLAIVRLELDHTMTYEPGQYVSVQVPSRPRMWRYLSLATPPTPDRIVEFHVRRVSGGWVSPAIVGESQIGDTWLIGSPLGSLGMWREPRRSRLMIGEGTGIAPLRAQLMDTTQRGDAPRTHLFVGGTYPCDLYDLDMLWALTRTNPQLTVIPVTEYSDNPWWVSRTSHTSGGVHDPLTGQISRVVAEYADWTDHDIEVVGSPSMVHTTKYRLMANGVDACNIRHDPLH